MHVVANQAQARAERKKLLLLQGSLYRLEISAAAANLKQGFGENPVATLMKPALSRLLNIESLVPVLVNVLPMVVGKGTLSVWLRRATMIVGVGSFALAVLRRKRKPAQNPAETSEEMPVRELGEST